jgi:hypothetical protein
MRKIDKDYSTLDIGKGVSIVWERPFVLITGGDEDDAKVERKELCIILHVDPRTEYEHLPLTNKQAKKLRDWLDKYLLMIGMY